LTRDQQTEGRTAQARLKTRLDPNPHFSHPLYCIGAMIRPDGVALGRPPRGVLDEYVCGALGYPLAGHAPCQTGPSAAS
jgi:hypothetical protein